MMRSPVVNDRVLAQKDSRVQRLLDSYKDNGKVIDELFVGTLSRDPDAAEKALRESEEVFRTLCAAAPVGVFRIDEQGSMVYANERLLEIHGLTMEQVRGPEFRVARPGATRTPPLAVSPEEASDGRSPSGAAGGIECGHTCGPAARSPMLDPSPMPSEGRRRAIFAAQPSRARVASHSRTVAMVCQVVSRCA